MAHQVVVKGVKDLLTAGWDKCDVVYPNGDGTAPADGSTFLLVQFPVSSTRRMSVTSRYYQEEGGVRLVLSVPRGEGIDNGLQLCFELAALFRDQAFGGVKFLVPGSPLFDDDNEDGKYFVFAFVTPYTYDFVG